MKLCKCECGRHLFSGALKYASLYIIAEATKAAAIKQTSRHLSSRSHSAAKTLPQLVVLGVYDAK